MRRVAVKIRPRNVSVAYRSYDVTLFPFGRGIRCDCGTRVDLYRGHLQASEA